MDTIILKTNINSKMDFNKVKNYLNNYYKINECTVDFEDIDKVVRLVGTKLNLKDIISKVSYLGYYCDELNY